MGCSSMLMLELLLLPRRGIIDEAEAEPTPGRDPIWSTARSKNAFCSASDGYCLSGRVTRIVSKLPVSNPGSTARNAIKLRIIKPVLTRRARASATWPDTRRSRRSVCRELSRAPLVDSWITLVNRDFEAWSATGSPIPAAVNPSTKRVNPKARASTVVSPIGPTVASSPAVRMPTPQNATAVPSIPPAAVSSADSVNSCRTRRRGPAPSAVRTANSRSRLPAVASSRLAMLTHAMSNTNPTAAHRAKSDDRAVRPRSTSVSGTTVKEWPRLASG